MRIEKKIERCKSAERFEQWLWIVSANGIKRRAQNWRMNARWVHAERMVRECKKWGTRKNFKGYVDCSWILANKFLESYNENKFDLIHIFFLDDPILRFSASTWNSRVWCSSLKLMINCKPCSKMNWDTQFPHLISLGTL